MRNRRIILGALTVAVIAIAAFLSGALTTSYARAYSDPMPSLGSWNKERPHWLKSIDGDSYRLATLRVNSHNCPGAFEKFAPRANASIYATTGNVLCFKHGAYRQSSMETYLELSRQIALILRAERGHGYDRDEAHRDLTYHVLERILHNQEVPHASLIARHAKLQDRISSSH